MSWPCIHAIHALKPKQCIKLVHGQKNGWEWTQSGRCMFSSQICGTFCPFSKTGCGWLWDCHSPNWQRDQLNACSTFSTRGELKRWPYHRQRRIGTGGARSDDLQDVGTPRSVLSGDSWNLSLETWKNLILRSLWQWIIMWSTKMLLSMNEIERERDWQD